MVHRAIKTFKQELTNIYDLLTIVEPSEEPKATNILIEGEKLSFAMEFIFDILRETSQ